MTPSKHWPGWDDGFYMARADPEREKRPRLEGEPIQLPKRVPFDGDRIVKAWAAIGLDQRAQLEQIRRNWIRIRKWQRRLKRKKRGH